MGVERWGRLAAGASPTIQEARGVRRNKKARRGTAGSQAERRDAWLDECFGNIRVELHGARMVAFHPVHLVPSLQHAVEFVDQQGNRFVTFVRLHGRIHVGALNLDVPLGRELHADRTVAIALQFHADAHDALLVTKQSFGFLADERLQRRGQFEMDAGYDQFVFVLAVHVSAYGFGLNDKAGTQPGPAKFIRRFLPARRALASRSAPTILVRRPDGRIFRYWKIVHRAGPKAGTAFALLQLIAAGARKI